MLKHARVPRRAKGRRKAVKLTLLIGLWCVVNSVFYVLMLQHDFSFVEIDRVAALEIEPDSPVAVTAIGPTKRLLPDEGLFQQTDAPLRMLMAIHPRCPCTQTTLRELERLLAIDPGRMHCTFLVYQPKDAGNEFADTANTRACAQFAQSTIEYDVDGSLAKQLGLTASGASMVYDESNQILFSGGITASRSCALENAGSMRVADLLRGNEVQPLTTKVFGCSLGSTSR